MKQKGPLIRFLSDVLYGVGVHDPIAFIGVPVFLLGIVLLASYILARRAVRVDPVVPSVTSKVRSKIEIEPRFLALLGMKPR